MNERLFTEEMLRKIEVPNVQIKSSNGLFRFLFGVCLGSITILVFERLF